eukprot:Seg2683.3 transcript_id=Seg2683.3/GoldUCD/mRNA.D3Y31 product="Heat shock factor 2-binding protein" protein_id=Seg2683.3/GoldUCD/D3Y31
MKDNIVTISRKILEDAVKTTKQLKYDTEQICGAVKEELTEIEKLKRDAEQWRNMQSKLESGSHVLVKRTDIERLITEAMQIKEYLPKVLKKDYYTAYARLDKVESDASKLKAEKTKISGELDRMTKKYKTTLGDLEHEREEKAELKVSYQHQFTWSSLCFMLMQHKDYETQRSHHPNNFNNFYLLREQ